MFAESLVLCRALAGELETPEAKQDRSKIRSPADLAYEHSWHEACYAIKMIRRRRIRSPE